MARVFCSTRNGELGYSERQMSLAQIEYFLAVAEEGSVSAAALRLYVAQPPVSRQIKLLEDELGAPLFERSTRGMRLLPAGERFRQHARRILEEIELARQSVAHSLSLITGTADAKNCDEAGTSCV